MIKRPKKILPRFIRKSIRLKLLGTFLIISIIPLLIVGAYTQYLIDSERIAVNVGMERLGNDVEELIREERQGQFASTKRLTEKTEETLSEVSEGTSKHVEEYHALYEEGLIDHETYIELQEDHHRFEGNIDEMNYSIRQNSREIDEGFSLTSELIISKIDKQILNEERKLDNLITNTRNMFLVSIFSGLIFAIIFSTLISKRTIEPVHKLQEGFDEIRKGNFDVSIETDAIDESGTLINDFNQSVSQLKDSQIKKIESNLALKEAYEELKTLDDLKTDLVANVSHELRTPITIVTSSLEIAKNLENKDERNEVLKMALEAISGQDLIVRDLIEAARLGVAPKVLTNINPTEILEKICNEFKIIAKRQEVKLDCRYKKDLPEVRADKKQIMHVVRNLINNAIKFNEKGGKVSVDAKQIGDFIEISVKDTGSGIPEDKLSKIFERFYQVDSSPTRGYGGTGLGLAIAKEIIESHGGEIRVKSKQGEGSSFYFTLPLLEDE